MAKYWNRVALTVARKTGIPVSLVTPTQMAIDAHFTSE